MINIIELLKEMSSKAFKFFAPAVGATSTAVDESVLVEFARQSGYPVKAVTNGLGECVGYTATNVAISNGESTAVGTVIDFTSRQVLVTEEIAASTAVAGGETVAVGSTVTEVTATTTGTALVGSTVASVGACVIAAIGGYALGKTVGDYLAEKYPNFWFDILGTSLYDAGCTLASVLPNPPVITYMDSTGQTYIPKNTATIIKNELIKVGAIQEEDMPIKDGLVPQPYMIDLDYITKWNEVVHENIICTPLLDKLPYGLYFTGYNNPADYLNLNVYDPTFDGVYSGTPRWSIKRIYTVNGVVVTSTAQYPSWMPDSETRASFTIRLSTQGLLPNYIKPGSEKWQCNTPIFFNLDAAKANIGGFSYVPDGYVAPETPFILPKPKITPNGSPDDDDKTVALPVPEIVPDYEIVPNPRQDPNSPTDPIAVNPTPFPKPVPQTIPEIPDPKPKVPEEPKLPINPTMAASALSRVFNPTQSQLDALGQYMWSSSRIEDLMKLFQSPADGVISLHAIYGTPSVGGEGEIKLGYLSTGVVAQIVTSQFVIIDCGTINIKERYNNATDYAPYTSIQIYLPFIGVQSLNPFDIIDSTIKCTYKIDVYTGACIAQLNVVRSGLNGVIYEFAGNCGYQLPLTSGNYIQALGNVIGGVIGGAAVGNIPGALLGGGHALLHSNVDVARSGNLSANVGILGNRKPYFIITRSIPKDALNYSKYYGFPSNKTVYLSECEGFTRVKDIILHTSANQEERSEILKLLKQGVYI